MQLKLRLFDNNTESMGVNVTGEITQNKSIIYVNFINANDANM